MKTKTTYLVGSIQDTDDPNASRERAEKKLQEFGFEVLNPCKLECNQTLAGTIEEQKEKLHNLKRAGQWEHFDEVMDAIIDSDLECVIKSEFIVVLWDSKKRHGGTIDEMFLAIEFGKPIFIVHNGVVEMNDWILRRLRRTIPLGTKFFPNVSQMLDHVEELYKEYIKAKGVRE